MVSSEKGSLDMSITDAIKAAAEGKPNDFSAEIEAVLNDRLADAIEQKRMEFASAMFGDDEDEEEFDEEDFEEEEEE